MLGTAERVEDRGLADAALQPKFAQLSIVGSGPKKLTQVPRGRVRSEVAKSEEDRSQSYPRAVPRNQSDSTNVLFDV